jgi:hypothetical protein
MAGFQKAYWASQNRGINRALAAQRRQRAREAAEKRSRLIEAEKHQRERERLAAVARKEAEQRRRAAWPGKKLAEFEDEEKRLLEESCYVFSSPSQETRAVEKLENDDVSENSRPASQPRSEYIRYISPGTVDDYGSTAILEELGIPFHVPRDGRMVLTFDLPWLWVYERYQMQIKTVSVVTPHETPKLKGDVESRMTNLKEFDNAMRLFGNFCILDGGLSDLGIGPAVYRLGSSTAEMDGAGGEKGTSATCTRETPVDEGHLSPDIPQQSGDKIAPWRRVLLCQGLSLVRKVLQSTENPPPSSDFALLPYLGFRGDDHPIKMTAELHLSCKRRVGSKLANPYMTICEGFHITFYEIVKNGRGLKSYEEWQTGNLYENPHAPDGVEVVFRYSAFTMLATAKDLTRVPKSTQWSKIVDPYWTILQLSPSGFFPEPPHGEEESDIYWMAIGKQQDKQIAELAYVVDALGIVEKRWRELNDYIAELLTEDFMDPKTYVKLLFDDETFTRSRRYFWVIGCLNEFDVSIGDNIKQWELFREARVTPLLKNLDAIPFSKLGGREQFQALDKEADNLREALEDLRSQFQNKLSTVKALRDGLFNASALIESRTSTRLGQNVKLLTYVSIFYLPLAFCASLWAVPDITEDTTRNPFIITAVLVGLVTYIIVFNLGNIAGLFGRKYHDRKTVVVEEMKQNGSKRWEDLGKKFEDFRPNTDRQTPSEWWIIVYQIQRIFIWKKQNKCPENIV